MRSVENHVSTIYLPAMADATLTLPEQSCAMETEVNEEVNVLYKVTSVSREGIQAI